MKHMKLKCLTAAVLAIGASSAFAATPTVCNSASTADVYVNTCTPDIEMYVGGSSALAPAITAVAPADLFDGTITIVHDGGSPNGTIGYNAVTAWYGKAKSTLGTAAGKNLFVVYNKQNGSAAGISQLLSTIKDTTIPEQDVVTIGPMSKVAGVVAAVGDQAASTGGSNNCSLGADTTSAGITYHNVTCTTHARTQADVGISDVRPDLLFALEGVKPKSLTTLNYYELANQGFGIGVNANLYNAMQTVQAADGRIPSTCVAGDLTAACQPTISHAEYASLITVTGGIKSAAALLGNSDTTLLTLSRRDDLSGTQASTNMYFADNACGNNVTPGKTTLIKGVLGGELALLGSPAPSPIVNPVYTIAGVLNVNDQNASSSVITDLTSTTGYAIGSVTLNSAEPARTATSWKFIKLDGISPNFNADGTLADHQRPAVANGLWGFQVTSFAAVQIKPFSKTSVVTTYPSVVAALIGTGPTKHDGGLSNSTLHNLEGIAYLDGAADPSVLDGSYKQAHYFHTNGNSCSPLIHK
ncbi:MAG: hypothetical protein WB870_02170 [Gallionellaceae bacterium]